MKIEVPSELKTLIGDSTWHETFEGLSGVRTYLLEGNDNRYLKVAPRNSDPGLLAEKQRLEWLQGKLPVPKILYYGDDTIGQFLLLSEIAGWMAHDEAFRANIHQLVRLLVVGLRQIHSVNIANCPFAKR